MAYSSGKYYPETKNGNVFHGSTAAAGTAFPISTGTAVTFGLWNTSSNKAAVLMALNVGVTSGTIALGEIGIANQYCGFAIGTAAPLSAFNAGTPKNGLLGMGGASSMQFTPAATTTLTAGGTACWWSGYAIESATPGLGVFRAQIDIDGQIIVPPGQLVFVCGSVAQTALFTMTLTWAEVPL
jgi:hypothetical protein